MSASPGSVVHVQATVHAFDSGTGGGSVLLDDGLLVPFEAAVFAESGLRHLRVGQRLTVEVTDDVTLVTALRIAGV